MKTIKRISGILRTVGIVMMLVAVVLWLYVLANTGKNWGSLSGRLAGEGVSTNVIDRLCFDSRYFRALSQAAGSRGQGSSEQRAEAIEGRFAAWTDKATEAAQTRMDEESEAVYRWFEEEFDAAAFSERYAVMENGAELQELREIFEYIDSLAAPPSKKGGPRLKPASQEPYFQEYYAAFSAEHEDAGSWYEFMRTVSVLIREDKDAGMAIKDVKAWMADSFTEERYFAALPVVRQEERAEDTESFADSLAALCERKAAGETVDFRALLDSTYASVYAKYPGSELGTRYTFLTSVRELLGEESFDGTYGSIAARMRDRYQEEQENGWTAWLKKYTGELVKEADDRGSIGVISFFWLVASCWLPMFLAGLALVLLTRLIHRLMSRRMLRERKKEVVTEEDDVLLRVEHLKQYFRDHNHVTKAVDDISFYVKKGEVFGLVGESGCGKTTTGRTIINLYDPTEGDVYFEGLRISSTQNGLPTLKRQLKNECREQIDKLKADTKEQITLHPEQAPALRAAAAQKIRELKENLRVRISKAEDTALESSIEKEKCVQFYREKRQAELTEAYEEDMKHLSGAAAEERKRRYETEMKVAAKDNIMARMQMIFQDPIASINPRMTVREIIAEGLVIRGVKDKDYINEKVYEMLELVGLVREHADRYPHEFSGGQRQRIGIARAIVMEPDLIIADEPISALDVSIQAQVINLLNDLRNRMGLTIMFIAHNLSVVKYFSDRIAVMYYGHIVEMTSSDELFEHPLHPYTKSLLSAIPYPDPHYEKTRKRIEYNPTKAHDYSVDKPTLREIRPGHWINCNDAEFAQYQKELGL